MIANTQINPAVQTALIRDLNDRFRQTLVGGRVVMTPGIASLAADEILSIMRQIRRFDGFDPGSDPHAEHDFGCIDASESKVFWTINYYAHGMAAGSEDPADPAKTVRVMTVMRADEY